jgi:DNA repair protein RadA/Sms
MKLDLGNPEVNDDTNILDIVIPEALKNIASCGIPHIDALFAGNGIRPTTTCMVTGSPGFGKSTLALQLADAVTGQGHVALYNTAEESLYQVGLTVERIKLKNGFKPGYELDVNELLVNSDRIRAKSPGKQFFLFVDSLQTLEVNHEGRGRPMGEQKMALEAMIRLVQWAKTDNGSGTFPILFVILQVTKKGVFEGKNKILHCADAHLGLDIDKDKDSDTFGRRIVSMSKNRFGPSGFLYPYELTSEGIEFQDA